MSLDWDIGKVVNRETLCYIGEGDKCKLNPVTFSLIHATMAVDLGKISKENVAEWLWRLEFLEAIRKGDWLLTDEGARSFTRDEVAAHIGLRTNVCDTKRPAFIKRWLKIIERDVDSTVHRMQAKAIAQAQEEHDLLKQA